MALTLPSLDTRDFADLMAEARSLIPGYDPGWTDFNSTDPGITLIELFAWLTEILIYRIDRITDRHRIAFLRLLNGPDWQPPATDPATLDGLVRDAVVALRTPWRAVTAADYEALALQAVPGAVGRAHCVARRNLDSRSEAARTSVADGHISVVIVPEDGEGTAPQPSDPLATAVAAFLEPRRLLTTRLHVVGPTYVPVQVALTVVRRSDADPQDTAAAVLAALAAKLDPLSGGTDGTGWPFGRALLVSEIYRAAAATPQVTAVINVTLASNPDPADADHEVAAMPYSANADGDQVGLRIGPHQLPSLRVDQSTVFVATDYQPLVVSATVSPMGITPAAAIRQAVRDGLWSGLDPAAGGPGGDDPAVISQDTLRTAVLSRLEPGGGAASLATLQALDLQDPTGAVVSSIAFAAGQLAELRLTITLAGGAG